LTPAKIALSISIVVLLSGILSSIGGVRICPEETIVQT
jgi:hypothetical protein